MDYLLGDDGNLDLGCFPFYLNGRCRRVRQPLNLRVSGWPGL